MSVSGGERRRAEIARALAADPKFMLLDEPFAGVDPISVGDIKDIIRTLKDRDIGVLITDHNVRDTLAICERAYIVSEGSVIAEGTPQEILENEIVREVYLGEDFFCLKLECSNRYWFSYAYCISCRTESRVNII